MATDDLDDSARRLWLLVREQVGSTSAAAEDARRLQSALADWRTKSQEFFSTSAGQWDKLRDELFGERFHLSALAALASPDWVVGDLAVRQQGDVVRAFVPASSSGFVGEMLEGVQRLEARQYPFSGW